MTSQLLTQKIIKNFPYELTKDQYSATTEIVDFLFSTNDRQAFILKGYAGTGKSLLIGSLVKVMNQHLQKTVLLAPTGRAAKVFSHYAEHPALTIHKKIYRQRKVAEGNSGFALAPNMHKHTLFIIDEASMIGNEAGDYSIFGTGRLLEDLIEYVYSGQGCRMMLIGDPAQLPPVKETRSPALDSQLLQSFSLETTECVLTEVVRQAENSDILRNATMLRNAIKINDTDNYPQFVIDKYSDMKRVSGEELIEEINDAYQRSGTAGTIVISRSNKRVNAYNNGIRNRVLYREEELSSGDMLMITRNNYTLLKDYEQFDFLANGEFVEVVRVRRYEEMYGFKFANVLLRHNDYDIEFEAKIIMDVLQNDSPGLTPEQYEKLFQSVMEDYAHITQKRDRYKKVKEDPYFNALQVKFGYAITCHKAQGGEWESVFLDIGYVDKSYMEESFYRWLYTSITRSTKMLYLVNLPNDFVAPSK